MFDSTLPIKGRILYLDLDVVIHANMDKLTGYHRDNFIGIHDFNRKFHPTWNYLNSSVLAWTHGTQSHIYEQFKQKPAEAQRLQGDQDWIWKLCKDKIKFWPKEWIMSYKWEIRSREELTVAQPTRRFKTVRHDVRPHPECSIAVFHGEPNPQDVQDKFVVDNWQ
jgi:lipopolysaccharide biosynthesis glycosyltransferase